MEQRGVKAFAGKYVVLLQDSPGVFGVTCLSDEAHFHLDGYLNKENVFFWISQNPRLTVANALHPDSHSAVCVIESRKNRSCDHRW
jgi:hypothetical protein